MMSLSSHFDVKTTLCVTSEEPAEPRGVGPRPETPGLERLLGGPYLLERRPVVGGAFSAQEGRRVRLLEPEVHLEPAVVRPARVRPGRFVAMDAEELPEVRRM